MSAPSPPHQEPWTSETATGSGGAEGLSESPTQGSGVGLSAADGGMVLGELSPSSSPLPGVMSCAEQNQAGRCRGHSRELAFQAVKGHSWFTSVQTHGFRPSRNKFVCDPNRSPMVSMSFSVNLGSDVI